MIIRPYTPADFDIIRTWVTDDRTHAMWCANLIPFPMTREGFETTLADGRERFGDKPLIAEEDGRAVGFFCLSDVNAENHELMLKFVIVDSASRGKGFGRQMLALAAKYAFDELGAEIVQLNVFTVNDPAKRCYLGAGFKERRVTENAFPYKDELWGRCNMFVKRGEV